MFLDDDMATEVKRKCVHDDLRASVVSILDEEFGGDVRSLARAKDVANKLEATIRSLEPKISAGGGDDSTPYRLVQILTSADTVLTDAKILLSRRSDLVTEVDAHSVLVEPTLDELRPAVEQVRLLEKYKRYLEWLQLIHTISTAIGDALESKSVQEAVVEFVTLSELCVIVHRTSCLNLRSFAEKTKHAWKIYLKNIFDKEFQEILKLMKWPFIPTIPGSHPTPAYDVLSRFETTFRYLLDIEPFSLYEEDGNWLLPLRLLFRPFRWRFIYHFAGNKKTNCLNKPEWYFTQVLSWIRTHVRYLDMFIQPILNRAGRPEVIATVDFINYLVLLVTDKLGVDISKAKSQEPILAHIIDETLLFERELRCYGYQPGDVPPAVSLLMKDNCFPTWMKLERETAMDIMDNVFANEGMWKPLCSDHNDSQDNRIPQCAEKFLTMILSITDRYKYLSVPSHSLHFLYLQLELIDDFRVRLLQLLREEAKEPLGSKFCAILNAVHYLANILKDWSDMPFFVEMHFYKVKHEELRQKHQRRRSVVDCRTEDDNDGNCLKASTSSSFSEHSHFFELNYLDDELEQSSRDLPEGAVFEGAIFDDIVALYERMKEDMLKTVADFTVLEVKAKSYHYRHEKWFSLRPLKDFVTPSLTPAACGMLMTLTSSLNALRDTLAFPLFTTAWQMMSTQLDDFFYEEVILVNKFNEGGAAQINYDITRNLFAIFSEYTRRPENHFKKIKESCIVLTLNVGSALLLHEALSSTTNTDHSKDIPKRHQREDGPLATHALEEIGIYRMSKCDVLDVLKLRTDLSNFH